MRTCFDEMKSQTLLGLMSHHAPLVPFQKKMTQRALVVLGWRRNRAGSPSFFVGDPAMLWVHKFVFRFIFPASKLTHLALILVKSYLAFFCRCCALHADTTFFSFCTRNCSPPLLTPCPLVLWGGQFLGRWFHSVYRRRN